MNPFLLEMLLAAPKRPEVPVAWQTDASRNFRFDVALMGGDDDLGLRMFGRASRAFSNQHVSLGLREMTICAGRCFDRFDWRPRVPHNNYNLGPPYLHAVVTHDSHHHSLAENARLEMGLATAIKGGLPVAVPLPPELPWRDFLQHTALAWNMSNLTDIPLPPW